ncbi:ATP-binding cassette domain-containing protein [bacterium]|nr:ATP-binding cassette domain-containing protein [bacterium]
MKTSKTSYIKALAQSLYPYRVKLSWGLASAGMAAAFDVAGPILLKIGIDFLQQSESIGWLYISTRSILLAAALAGFFRYFGRLNVISVSRFAECDIRNTFFNHFLKLSPTFYDQNQTGDMMARATEDLERVRMVLGPALLYIVNTILILIFSAIMMFMLDSIMACVVIGLAPILAIVVFFVAKRLHEANIEQQTAYSSLSSQVQENLSGFRVVKAFVREDHESRKFADVCHEYFLKSMKVAKVQALFMPLLGTIVGFGIAAILWMGGNRIVLGEMTLGSFIAFMSYLSLMTWPMIALGWMTHLYQRGGASHFRIKEMLKIPPQFDSEGINKSIENAFAPEIVFNEVTLTYENRNTETLSKVSLTIKSNSTIAIVGQVGSGKSSLVRLIPRLYEPNEGNILLNGTDIKDLCVDDLRKSVGYVDQSLFLFSASIRENIAKGRIEASLEEIIQSAIVAD